MKSQLPLPFAELLHDARVAFNAACTASEDAMYRVVQLKVNEMLSLAVPSIGAQSSFTPPLSGFADVCVVFIVF